MLSPVPQLTEGRIIFAISIVCCGIFSSSTKRNLMLCSMFSSQYQSAFIPSSEAVQENHALNYDSQVVFPLQLPATLSKRVLNSRNQEEGHFPSQESKNHCNLFLFVMWPACLLLLVLICPASPVLIPTMTQILPSNQRKIKLCSNIFRLNSLHQTEIVANLLTEELLCTPYIRQDTPSQQQLYNISCKKNTHC